MVLHGGGVEKGIGIMLSKKGPKNGRRRLGVVFHLLKKGVLSPSLENISEAV